MILFFIYVFLILYFYEIILILLNINLKEMIEIRDAGGHRIKMILSWKKNSSFHIFWLQIPNWSHLKFYSCLFYSDIKRLGLLLQHDMRACTDI